MTGGLWAVAPFTGTYYETTTGFGLPVADWSISNQYLDRDLTAAVLTDDGYAVHLRRSRHERLRLHRRVLLLGLGLYYEGPFWLDVELDLYSYLGLDYDTIRDAWVDPTGRPSPGPDSQCRCRTPRSPPTLRPSP